MSRYDEAVGILTQTCGNGKDNVIALATIAVGEVCPAVREVDAHFEDGAFYIMTTANTAKIREIAQNGNVAFSVGLAAVNGVGVGENLGWVLDPKNADVRAKVRKTFADWYDLANNEDDTNCVILKVTVTRCTINQDHGAVHYEINFADKTAV